MRLYYEKNSSFRDNAQKQDFIKQVIIINITPGIHGSTLVFTVNQRFFKREKLYNHVQGDSYGK